MRKEYRVMLRVVVLLIAVLGSLCGTCGDIFRAVEMEDLHALALLTNDVRQVNSVNAFGDTPIMIVARNGDVAMTRMLIDAGADLEILNHGVSVKGQVEGYLRKTGESRRKINVAFKELGANPETVRSFEKTADALGGTPERRQKWKTILGLLRERSSSGISEDSRGMSNRRRNKKYSVDRGKLKMDDFDRILSSVSAISNGVCVVAKNRNVRYFVILNDKEAMNVQGETPIGVPAGGSLKLVSRDSMLCLKALAAKDDSLLWQFDVELKFVNEGEMEDEIFSRSGILAARKNDQKIVVLTAE